MVNHGARPSSQALLYAIWLLVVFSLFATPLLATAAGALVGAGSGALVLLILARARGVAYVLALATSLVPSCAGVAARDAVANRLEARDCEKAGRRWDATVEECGDQAPADPK